MPGDKDKFDLPDPSDQGDESFSDFPSADADTDFEEWKRHYLADKEQELKEKEAEHHRAIEKLKWEHRDAISLLDAKITKTEKHLAQHLQALHIREEQLAQSKQKEHELQEQVTKLSRERDEAVEALAHGSAVQAEPVAVAAAPAPLEVPPTLTLADEIVVPHEPVFTPELLLTMVVGAIVICTVILTLLAAYAPKPQYHLQGTLVTMPGNTADLSACEKLARTPEIAPPGKTIVTRADPAAGTCSLLLISSDPRTGAATVDGIGRAIVQRLRERSATQATSTAASDDEIARLQAEIERCDRRLASSVPPATQPQEELATLLVSLNQAHEEQAGIDDAIKGLATRIADESPPQSQAGPSPNQQQDTELLARKLQADMAALQQRQGRLADLLAELLEPGDYRFKSLLESISRGNAFLTEALQADHEDQVITLMRTMQDSLAIWSQAAETFNEVWLNREAQVKSGEQEIDALACQSALETAAKTFLDETAKSRIEFQNALSAIREGGEEPTKRIILHRNLSQQLKPAIEAMNKVEWAARLVILNENVQLAAVVRTVISLQARVASQRSQIEADTRERLLAEEHARRTKEIAQAKAEREQLRTRTGILQTDIINATGRIISVLRGHEAKLRTAQDKIALHQQRAALVDRLRASKSTAAALPPIPLFYLPASVVRIEQSAIPSLSATLAIGLMPMVICSMLGIAMWGILSWKRAGQAISTYAKQLESAADAKHHE